MATPLTEAFKALDILNEDTFDYSKQGIDHLEKFLDADNLEDTVTVIDTEAETEDELKDSYIGKVIFECPVCDTLNYHDKETVEIDEDDNLANIDEECPYCHSVGGFKIIGEVAPYHETEVEVETTEEEKIEEACGRRTHKRIVKESDKPAATSIEDAQKWVDYDMEKYGKISGRTNALVKKAGFQVVKDIHGDYEVVAGHFEALKEAKHVTPRTRDDIDAIADDKKERARARFAKAKDDADADRDYQLKRNKLKEQDEDVYVFTEVSEPFDDFESLVGDITGDGIVITGNDAYKSFGDKELKRIIKKSEDDDSALSSLEEKTGKEYDSNYINGSTQREWNRIYYPVDTSVEFLSAIEDYYFGNYSGYDNPDYGYITIPNYLGIYEKEDIKKYIAHEIGVPEDKVKIRKFTGYSWVANYDESRHRNPGKKKLKEAPIYSPTTQFDSRKSFRDYQLKRNNLKEAAEDGIIRGNPTITWKVEDEERYNSGEPDGDETDLAAYAAYLVDRAGEKLYAFGGMDDEDNTMLLDITGDGNLQKYSFVRGRLRLEENKLKESVEDAVQVLGEDDYIFHEETGDIAITKDLANFAPGVYFKVKFEEDESDKIYEYKMIRLSKDRNYIECEYITDDVEEGLIGDAIKNSPFGKIMGVVNGLTEEVVEEDNVSKAIDIINSAGIIAKALNDNMDEIKTAAKSVMNLKDKVKNLIGSTKAADSDVAKTLEKDIETQDSPSSILNTISNWINKINQVKNLLTEETSCEACAEVKEAKNLTQTEGTIANLLTKHADDLNAAATSAAALKSKMIEIVKNSTLADTPAAKRFYHTLETKKSLGALLSTMGTWMTGNKAYESLENIELTTGTEKIKISTEKKEEEKHEDETIVPVDVDTAEEILDNSEGETEDEVSFEEDELAELGESYLKNVYNNVKSFKTTNVSKDGTSIKVEGLINFNSGSKKQTSFTFSPKETSKTGKVRYIGENLGITSNKKAFTLTGKRDGNKLMLESLTYNYGVKNNNGKSTRVYGRVNKKSK